ncbi:S4 domain-containing protein YaaA [Paenibacillus sp. y28]|uniref:S4 domain-containing protein YaaA n=1 Tax=Paenibacillus sp. y28 TaxID=3129110 RepID=UPI0030179F84
MTTIQIRDEYITLGQFLKLSDCISTGGQAKPFLEETRITVNGEPEQRRGRKLYRGDKIWIDGFDTFEIG